MRSFSLLAAENNDLIADSVRSVGLVVVCSRGYRETKRRNVSSNGVPSGLILASSDRHDFRVLSAAKMVGSMGRRTSDRRRRLRVGNFLRLRRSGQRAERP